MGHKNVCVNCRKSFSLGTDLDNIREGNCPQCGKRMEQVSHRFRPPKKTDLKKWEVVEYLLQNAFYYDHIQDPEYNSWVPYPENMKDAIEFVKKYKYKRY